MICKVIKPNYRGILHSKEIVRSNMQSSCEFHQTIDRRVSIIAFILLYDIVLLICKLRINGFQTIRVSQVHQMIAKKHGCAVESITGYVIAPLRNAALFRDPVIQPYLYGNKSFQVCRVYGSLATRLLDGLPLILCKSNVSFYFDQEGHPMN